MTAANLSMAASQATSSVKEATIERIFDAPRELVFKMWTDPKHVAAWWGPKVFTNPVCELDARPGGAILIHMASPDGSVLPMKGEFKEIVPPERIVMATYALETEDGSFLLEGLTTALFADHEGKTKLTVHAQITKAAPEAAGALAGMEEGWNQSLDKLTAYVETL